jgi:hypothetical protein
MNKEIQNWLDECKNKVATGKWIPSQYAEQMYIELAGEEITSAEFDERMAAMPFCPLFVGV